MKFANLWEEQGAVRMLLRLLEHRLGEVPEALRDRITWLPTPKVEPLGIALIGFQSLADVERWLAAEVPEPEDARGPRKPFRMAPTKVYAKSMVRLLRNNLGEVPDTLRERILGFSMHQIEQLADVILHFKSVSDLERWLSKLRPLP